MPICCMNCFASSHSSLLASDLKLYRTITLSLSLNLALTYAIIPSFLEIMSLVADREAQKLLKHLVLRVL